MSCHHVEYVVECEGVIWVLGVLGVRRYVRGLTVTDADERVSCVVAEVVLGPGWIVEDAWLVITVEKVSKEGVHLFGYWSCYSHAWSVI